MLIRNNSQTQRSACRSGVVRTQRLNPSSPRVRAERVPRGSRSRLKRATSRCERGGGRLASSVKMARGQRPANICARDGNRFAQHSKKRRPCSFPKRFLVRKLRVPAPLLLVRKRAHFSHAFELHFASQRRRKSASERPFSSVQKRLFFTARCGSKVRPKHVLERSFFNSHLEISQC